VQFDSEQCETGAISLRYFASSPWYKERLKNREFCLGANLTEMNTHDMGTLSYFARHMDSAAGTEREIEEGERVRIIGAWNIGMVGAVRVSDRPIVLPGSGAKPFRVMKSVNSHRSLKPQLF
jgi:hypothetical protein